MKPHEWGTQTILWVGHPPSVQRGDEDAATAGAGLLTLPRSNAARGVIGGEQILAHVRIEGPALGAGFSIFFERSVNLRCVGMGKVEGRVGDGLAERITQRANQQDAQYDALGLTFEAVAM